MTAHVSSQGIERDDHGFFFVSCQCGIEVGAAPDEETALDMAMEHAYRAAMKEWEDASA